MRNSVAKETFDWAVRLFESGYPQIDGGSLEENFPAQVRAELLGFKVLKDGPLVTAVEDDTDFNVGCVRPEWDPEKKCYVFFSPAAVAWVRVPDEHMKSYILDQEWFCREIQNRLEIPGKRASRCLLEDYLWDLGSAWIGRNKVSILLCREMFHVAAFDQVHDVLRDRTDIPLPAVALCTSLNMSRHAVFPGGIRIQSLSDCVTETRWGFGLDRGVLENALFRTTGAGRGYSPVEHNFDYSSVRVKGREFIFRGDKQKGILRILIRDFNTGRKKSRVQTVLEEAGSKSTNIPRAFGSASSDWRGLIGYGDGGFCWLKI